MGMYWIGQAASKASWAENLSEEFYAIAAAAGMVIMYGIGYFFMDDEPQLPAHMHSGWQPCYAQ